MFDLHKMAYCLKILSEKVIFCGHSYFLSFGYIKLWKSQVYQTGI